MSYADGVYLNRGPVPVPPSERFWFRVDKSGDGGCWNWTGCIQSNGYGRLAGEPGEVLNAHRFSYELNVGPIPDGMFIDHLCRNRGCVNPAHLEPISNGDNTYRGVLFRREARQGKCKRGHEMTPENTYHRDGNPRRAECRTCRIAAANRSRERARANRTEAPA